MLKYIAAALVLIPVGASAQVSCTTIGTYTTCSNGQSVQSIGNLDMYSNGGSGQHIGNQYIYTPPVAPIQPYQPQPWAPVPPYRPQR
jgi:hypothetical protein